MTPPDEDPVTTQWRALLTGEDPQPPRGPASLAPRAIGTPLQGVRLALPRASAGPSARLFWHGPMRDNPLLCKACFGQLSRHPGGAELEISVVFADVRGSTGLAERSSASTFHGLIQAYYRSAAAAIDANDGIIDKFLGDGVMALFIPVITGENHAGRAIAAVLGAILVAVERDGLARKGLMVGAGVHTGAAFVGVVGSNEKIDFTALGDTVNIAARLGGLAGPGELLVSRDAWERARLGPPRAQREVEIAGWTGSLTVVSTHAAVEVVGKISASR